MIYIHFNGSFSGAGQKHPFSVPLLPILPCYLYYRSGLKNLRRGSLFPRRFSLLDLPHVFQRIVNDEHDIAVFKDNVDSCTPRIPELLNMISSTIIDDDGILKQFFQLIL
jgi:hypothetical protein